MYNTWVDAGVNLPADDKLDRFRAELDAADNAGVTRFVLIASDVAEARRAIAFAETDARCVVTAGVHPHQASKATPDFIAELRELARHPAVRAIGECGLDYNRNFSEPADQRRVFAAQVELAIEVGLPLYLHERDALTDQLAILKPAREQLAALFTHCFTGDVHALQAYQELDCYIGITGWVCDERRGHDLAQAVASIDGQRLIVETDAPYLLPRTLRPRPKSRHNQPKHVAHIGDRVASLRDQSTEEVQALSTHNALRLFGTWNQ
ncbi:TatD family hydrolase [Aliidiomarina sp. Khilg15.8]